MRCSELAQVIIDYLKAKPDHGLIFHFNPATGQGEDWNMYVPIPGTELRVNGALLPVALTEHLYQNLVCCGMTGDSGCRCHDKGKGYCMHCPEDLRVQVYRWDRYVYVSLAWMRMSAAAANTLASSVGTDGYWDSTQRHWVKRAEYGDYRRDHEPIGRSIQALTEQP